MKAREFQILGKRALSLILAFCMSIMMLPAMAFADNNDDDIGDSRAYYEVDVNVSGGEQSETIDNDINTDYGGVRAKATNGGSATATINGSVNAGEDSFGVYVSARGNASTNATVNIDNVTAGAGVHVDTRTGTATLNAGNIKATKGAAENIDPNTFSASSNGTINAVLGDIDSVANGLSLDASYNGGFVNAKVDTITASGTGLIASSGGGKIAAEVNDIFSKNRALLIESEDGEINVTVNGDAMSSEENGLVFIQLGNGTAAVTVAGTLSGETNGVVLGSDASSFDLTVWRIEAGESGGLIVGQNVESFAKTVNYIVRTEEPAEGATITALKADGTALDTHQGYGVAHEDEKVILKVDVQEGYVLKGVYNGMSESVPLSKDENGNYYVTVARGGGIYLYALLEGANDVFRVIPPAQTLVTTITSEDSSAASTNANENSYAVSRTPLLTYKGVEINELELEMDGQSPVLRTKLSNTNDQDIKFDCTKFKVVNVENDNEIAFKTETKELKANESSVECKFTANANAMKAGDRAYVFYDGQLLGTFTVK